MMFVVFFFFKVSSRCFFNAVLFVFCIMTKSLRRRVVTLSYFTILLNMYSNALLISLFVHYLNQSSSRSTTRHHKKEKGNIVSKRVIKAQKRQLIFYCLKDTYCIYTDDCIHVS